jgi:hypothetical protein
MRRIGNHDGNVIEMAGYWGETRFRSLNEVEAYWEGLRRNGEVPRRTDIDPRGIENALEYAFILERIAPGLARLRIAGMHLSDLMGMEVRGMPISSFLPPAARNSFGETLEQVMDNPAKARLTLSAEDGVGKPPLEGRMILLPMQNDLGDVSRVLGCFETSGKIGRAPRRFNILQTELTPLDLSPPARRRTDAPGPAASQAKRPLPEPAVPGVPGLSEPSRPFKDAGKSGARPSYLRLIKSDD